VPVLIFDTGFLYSLAADRTYSAALRGAWQDHELWVPASVVGEISYRQRKPVASVPTQLPNAAKGLILSNSWKFEVLALTEPELEETELLRERIGDTDPNRNRGECEAVVFLTSRAPEAGIRLDDLSCLPVIARYVTQRAGVPLSYATTSNVLDGLVDSNILTAAQRSDVGANLTSLGRPYA
jgi:hypothetical protein